LIWRVRNEGPCIIIVKMDDHALGEFVATDVAVEVEAAMLMLLLLPDDKRKPKRKRKQSEH